MSTAPMLSPSQDSMIRIISCMNMRSCPNHPITFEVDSILDLLCIILSSKICNSSFGLCNMLSIGILLSKESFLLDLSSQDIIDKTARSAGKRALCMGGAKNHLIAMPDCDEVGLQEYRNKGLEKSVGFVLKHVKHSRPLARFNHSIIQFQDLCFQICVFLVAFV